MLSSLAKAALGSQAEAALSSEAKAELGSQAEAALGSEAILPHSGLLLLRPELQLPCLAQVCCL